MNKIQLSIIVTSIAENKLGFYGRISSNKHQSSRPIFFALPTPNQAIRPGDILAIEGKLKSRDMVYKNSCHCHTTTTGVETYCEVDNYQPLGVFYNRVAVSGVVVGNCRVVKTETHPFLSLRIRLEEGNGYLTCTVDDTSYLPQSGDTVRLEGILKLKDYDKTLKCSSCEATTVLPTVSVWIRARTCQGGAE